VNTTVLPVVSRLTAPATAPAELVSVRSPAPTVSGSRPWSNVARTVVPVATPVALLAGVVLLTAGGVSGSTTSVLCGVVGWAPMSASALTVACAIRSSGSPSLWAFVARPRHQLLVPLANTTAPLAAR
jgi:hypothetical protein